MYYRCFFCKENAYNAIFFISILIFAVIKSLFFPEELSNISLGLSVFITFFTLLDLFIKALERIIKEQDDDMQSTEKYLTNNYHNDDFAFSFLPIRSMKKEQFAEYLSKIELIFKDQSDKENLTLFWEISKVQRGFRKVRRILLYIYYSILVAIIVYLMFSTNIALCTNGIELPDLTIWSFVIILFDLLLSQPIFAAIFKRLSKYYNKNAEKLTEFKKTQAVLKGKENGQAENAQ